jgi:hypothetical protein
MMSDQTASRPASLDGRIHREPGGGLTIMEARVIRAICCAGFICHRDS